MKMTVEKSFFIHRIRIRIHLFSLISVVALFLADSGVYSFIVILCAVLHEFGHIIAIHISGAKITDVCFLPFGMEIKTSGKTGYIHDFFISLAGPALNLLTFSICSAVFLFFKHPIILFCGICSLFLAVINLIPVRSFDGGRALKSLAFLFFEYEKALKIIHFSELFSLIILCFAACVSVILCEGNISLAVICIYIFVSAYRNCFRG